jgi:hypothetical protein
MIFKRKKPTVVTDSGQHVMRGRDSGENGQHSSSGNDDNPLARRFHPQDEPDTIDLQQTSGFPAADIQPKESDTRDLSAASGTTRESAMAGALNVISYVPETGKFYLQPGEGDDPVLLGNNPINAPTELRHGDRIRIASTELLLQPADHKSGPE